MLLHLGPGWERELRMKKSKKKSQAIELLASGKTVIETAATIGCSDDDVRAFMKDPEFIDLVDARYAELAHEGRWQLMRYRDAAFALIQKSMTGTSLSTSQQKMVSSVLRSLGVIVTEPPKPMPVGELKIQLGSRRKENLLPDPKAPVILPENEPVDE